MRGNAVGWDGFLFKSRGEAKKIPQRQPSVEGGREDDFFSNRRSTPLDLKRKMWGWEQRSFVVWKKPLLNSLTKVNFDNAP
jgi:hypothetical protein